MKYCYIYKLEYYLSFFRGFFWVVDDKWEEEFKLENVWRVRFIGEFGIKWGDFIKFFF